MESNDIIINLINTINQINQINKTSLSLTQERTAEIEEKKSVLILKVVGCFDEILSNNLIYKNQKSPEMKDSKNHYWVFISEHFNTPVIRFCIIYDKNELSNADQTEIFNQKGKNWIYFSILEKSFSDSISEIYKQGWDTLYYREKSIIREYKEEIIKIINDLKEIQLNDIKCKDFEKYQDFIKKNHLFNEEEENISLSPIISKRTGMSQILVSDFSIIPIEANLENDDSNINEIIDIHIPEVIEEKEFTFTKFADFGPSIINNFYTFVPESEINNINKENNNNNKEDIINSISFSNLNSINNKDNDKNSENDHYFSKNDEEEVKLLPGLILNPKISKHLPSDNLYEINEKTLSKEYNKNDKLTYNKKKRPISNSLLLYLNEFYQKAPYHKFFKHNLYNRPISLKEQNFQCYICQKKFSLIFDIPIEQIFWCSYYMRFVCKNCINHEYSIIPYFILKEWCFKKFPISKKAKNILVEWYNKPIIYFKKSNNTDKFFKKVPQLNKVIEIKKVIHNIFDRMKCENKFKFVKEILGEYEYLPLKEYIFSMRDLVEIKNKIFYKKINQFKNKFIKHISGECPECLIEGEICSKCGFDEKIFFYDIDNVIYCKICKKSFHKKCIDLVGHFHEYNYY